MSEAIDQGTTTQHGQQDGNDRLQPHSPAQQQSGENFNGIGENGTNDLGDFGNIAGGVGGSADTSGSAAGATIGGGMEQTQPGYGSTGQTGYGDQSGGMGGSTGGQQNGEEMDQDGRMVSSDDDDEDDLGDGVGASSAAGPAI